MANTALDLVRLRPVEVPQRRRVHRPSVCRLLGVVQSRRTHRSASAMSGREDNRHWTTGLRLRSCPLLRIPPASAASDLRPGGPGAPAGARLLPGASRGGVGRHPRYISDVERGRRNVGMSGTSTGSPGPSRSTCRRSWPRSRWRGLNERAPDRSDHPALASQGDEPSAPEVRRRARHMGRPNGTWTGPSLVRIG